VYTEWENPKFFNHEIHKIHEIKINYFVRTGAVYSMPPLLKGEVVVFASLSEANGRYRGEVL